MEGVERKNLSTKSVLFCGGMAGVANWLVSVPPDTIKSRFQSAPPGRYPGGAMQVVMLAFVFVSVLTRERERARWCHVHDCSLQGLGLAI